MNEKNLEKLHQLNEKLLNIIKESGDELPYYEIGFIMIRLATHMLLSCASDTVTGIKTILVSVEQGIEEYEKDKKEGKKNE